jgi:hypothetical protein
LPKRAKGRTRFDRGLFVERHHVDFGAPHQRVDVRDRVDRPAPDHHKAAFEMGHR